MNDKLVISKRRKKKGQYGYKVFSVRVKEETVESAIKSLKDKSFKE